MRALWVKQLRQSRKWSRRTDFTSFWCKCHFSVLPKNIRPSTNLVFSISGSQNWLLIIIVLSRSLIYDGDYWHDFAETTVCTSPPDLSGYSDQDHVRIMWGGKFWSSDWWSLCRWLLWTLDLIDDTARRKAFLLSIFFVFLYPVVSMIWMTMRITRMMTMILWTGGRENFLIVRFLRDALDCIWCAVNRITVDQHDGQLHPFDQLHLHHQHHVTFATNTFWATSWSWLGILLLTCQRGKSRNYLRRICHISGCHSEMLTHCTSWQQNFYVRVKYHFILDFTLWMELWDYETSWVTQGFCWLQVYPVSLSLQFGKEFCNLRLQEILYCSSVLRPYDALLFTATSRSISMSQCHKGG